MGGGEVNSLLTEIGLLNGKVGTIANCFSEEEILLFVSLCGPISEVVQYRANPRPGQSKL